MADGKRWVPIAKVGARSASGQVYTAEGLMRNAEEHPDRLRFNAEAGTLEVDQDTILEVARAARRNVSAEMLACTACGRPVSFAGTSSGEWCEDCAPGATGAPGDPGA